MGGRQQLERRQQDLHLRYPTGRERQDGQGHARLRRRLRYGSARALLGPVSRRRTGDEYSAASERVGKAARDNTDHRLQGHRVRDQGCAGDAAAVGLDDRQAHSGRRRRRDRQGAQRDPGRHQKEQPHAGRSAPHGHDQLGRRELRFRHRAAGQSQRHRADRSGQGRAVVRGQGLDDFVHRLARAAAADAPFVARLRLHARLRVRRKLNGSGPYVR